MNRCRTGYSRVLMLVARVVFRPTPKKIPGIFFCLGTYLYFMVLSYRRNGGDRLRLFSRFLPGRHPLLPTSRHE